MELLIGLFINLLILAIIAAVLFWVLGIIATAFEFPPKIVALIKALFALIVLLWFLQILLPGGYAFYPVHLHR